MSRERSFAGRVFLAVRIFGFIALVTRGGAMAGPLTSMPLAFEPNRGQHWGDAQFLARTPGASVFLTAEGPVFALPSGDSFRMRLVGARRARLEGRDLELGEVNYFIGADPSAWRTGIPIYRQVVSDRALPGVDLVFYGNQRQLEYDIKVAAGTDARVVRWVFEGTSGLHLDSAGSLVVTVGAAQVRQERPRIFQSLGRGVQREVSGEYVITGEREVAFRLGNYDRKKTLTIDPILVFSSYLGGRGDDQGLGIAVDATGAIYISGETTSPDFPSAIGTHQPSFSTSDAFVAKLNPAGTAIVYATYLGGSGRDSGNAIAVDAAGNAYVAGETESSDFPTMNPFQSAIGGPRNAFVTKLNPSGGMVYSTYLGGGLTDSAFSIAVDGAGSAYVCGETHSSNFPTQAPLQALGAGGTDGFVTKLAPSGSQLVYSTYLGGGQGDHANAIAVDASGAAYITGDTASPNFPIVNAIQSRNAGRVNAFVSKLNPAGSALVYSTYFGGVGGVDAAQGIALDGSGGAVVVGYSWSAAFPTTTAAVQGGNAGYADAFAFRVAPDGRSATYSTLFGGSGDDWANALSVDSAGNAYIVGVTSSSDFPAVNAIQPSLNATFNAFVTALDPLGTMFLYSTFLGGSGGDQATAIALDASGNVYLTGITDSTDYPRVAALQSYQGGDDALVSKLAPSRALPLASIDPPFGSGFRRRTVMIRGAGFVPGATVSFGGVASPTVTVVNSNLITASTPPHADGLVDVVITNPDGTTGTFTSGFQFVEPDRGGCQSTPRSNPFGTIVPAALILLWLFCRRPRTN